MPKLYSYHTAGAAATTTPALGVRAPRLSVLSLSLLLSVFFTAPLLYFLGVTCRPSPAAIAAAVRILESRHPADHFSLLTDSATATHPTPTASPSEPPRSHRRLHKYDLLNDLFDGDNPASAQFIDVDNDVFLNGSLANLNATLPLDARSLVQQVTVGHRADWLTVGAYHRFCDNMLTNPMPAPVPLCARGVAMECVDGALRNETPFFARQGQDFYLHVEHFHRLNRSGVYVDVGTRHPVMGSPTYFFDACLRWRGVCVEANPDVYQYIHRQRACDLAPTCVTARDNTKVTFVAKPPHGGILGHDRLHPSLRNKTARDGVMKTRLICTNVAALAKRQNIRLVDLVTLSVDGQELDVLQGFDFNAQLVNVFLVAVSNETFPAIHAFLKKEGYVHHLPVLNNQTVPNGLLGNDAIFVHHDVVWGQPI